MTSTAFDQYGLLSGDEPPDLGLDHVRKAPCSPWAAAGAPPPLQASGAAVDVAHEKEDAGAVDRTVLKYAPQYFVAPTQAEPPPFEQQT